MENVNEAVTEGLKSLAGALSRGGTQHPPARVLARTVQAALRSGTSTDALEAEDEVSPELETEQDESEEADDETVIVATAASRPRKFKAPAFLRDLNLTEA